MHNSLFDLGGRIALVTGASSGLGSHFARLLSGAGARVALAARRSDKLDDLATELTADGGEALVVAMDVTNRASVDAAMERVQKQFGGLDVLVNNAGVAETERFLDIEDASWQKTIDVNLTGVFRVGQAAGRLMATSGGGAIVNIASVLGFVVQPTQAAYAASKAGVVHLTRSMALELRRHDIRVNAIAPGYFVTEMNRRFFETEGGQQLAKRLIPGRTGEARELDGALLLLASDAGSYINGTCIVVDGGTMLGGM